MTDIVERLRDAATPYRFGLYDDAAHEIERLRAALRRIADHPQGQVFSAGFAPDDAHEMQEIAILAIGANEQSEKPSEPVPHPLCPNPATCLCAPGDVCEQGW